MFPPEILRQFHPVPERSRVVGEVPRCRAVVPKELVGRPSFRLFKNTILINCSTCTYGNSLLMTSSGTGGGRVSLVTTLNLLNIASLSAPEKTLKGKYNREQSIKKCN